MAAQDDNFYNKVLIDFFEKNPKYNNILTRRIMNEYIKTLIEANKDAVSNIAVLLINENILKDDEGNYYQKIEEEEEVPEEGKLANK